MGMRIVFPEISFRIGTKANSKSNESAVDSKVIRNDSLKNWSISWTRTAPMTFRTPTSLVRCVARAVERFTKLKTAINKTTNPTAMNIRKYAILPVFTQSP
jgi:hypothetical protein